MSKKYKALFVDENTHYKVVVKARIKKMTIDKFISELLKQYETKTR